MRKNRIHSKKRKMSNLFQLVLDIVTSEATTPNEEKKAAAETKAAETKTETKLETKEEIKENAPINTLTPSNSATLNAIRSSPFMHSFMNILLNYVTTDIEILLDGTDGNKYIDRFFTKNLRRDLA